MKQNRIDHTPRVVLPLPPSPGEEARFEMEIYARFMGHLREVPNSRLEIKILSAICFTADMTDVAEALVSKTLVDLGLRAPRKAFPATFLNFVDRGIKRELWDHRPLPASLQCLQNHWEQIGENRFEPLLRGNITTVSPVGFAIAPVE